MSDLLILRADEFIVLEAVGRAPEDGGIEGVDRHIDALVGQEVGELARDFLDMLVIKVARLGVFAAVPLFGEGFENANLKDLPWLKPRA